MRTIEISVLPIILVLLMLGHLASEYYKHTEKLAAMRCEVSK